MTHILALSNQKGGVGKTTSAVNLATELADAGCNVLLVDFDPQGSATSGLGLSPLEDEKDIYDMFFGETTLKAIIKETDIPRLYLAPASKDLVGLEIELGKRPGRELILKSELNLLRSTFDIVLVDCPPSSGLLTLNAMGAATGILIPLQAEYYALEGLSALLETIAFVRQTFNPALLVQGVFLTMFDARTNLASQVEDEARAFFVNEIFETRIPRNVKISESPSHGLPVSRYAPESAGAIAYRELAQELIDRLQLNSLTEEGRTVDQVANE